MEITDQERIERAIQQQRSMYMEASSDLMIWHDPRMTKENFWSLLNATAQAIMAKRGVYHPFVVDDNNREIILQMWLYATGSKECKWNIHKGIYIGGKVGCGKTLLMQAFMEMPL